jgi:hypothetical protein
VSEIWEKINVSMTTLLYFVATCVSSRKKGGKYTTFHILSKKFHFKYLREQESEEWQISRKNIDIFLINIST